MGLWRADGDDRTDNRARVSNFNRTMSQGNTSSSRSHAILGKIFTTGILGILNTSAIVSFATLIFADDCPDYLGTGIAFFLMGAAASGILLALMSSYAGIVGSIQSVPVVISGLMAGTLGAMLEGGGQGVVFSHVCVAIAVSSVLTGICFIVLARFSLGNMVRFVPFPVMAGFLAGAGWLLLKGGLKVATSLDFHVLHAGSFLKSVDTRQLLCVSATGIVLLLLTRFFRANTLVLPLGIVGSMAIFYAVATFMGVSVESLNRDGWLLGSVPRTALWRSLAIPDLAHVEWALIFRQASSIGTIAILCVITFLLNETGVEFVAGRDLDVNRDLYVTGAANVFAGLMGTPVSFVNISQTTLATRMGEKDRAVGILNGLLLLCVLAFGGAVIAFFPKFVAGGLLVYLGLTLLSQWLVDSRKSVPKPDFAVIVSILAIVEFLGFLQGIAVGVVASVAIFVFRYSAVNLVKNVFDGGTMRSGKSRPITDQRMLDYNAEKILILQLHGFIFFGTAHSLYETVKNYVSTPNKIIRYVIIDMDLVRGVDSSAVKSFEKLARRLSESTIELLLVNLDSSIRNMFDRSEFNRTVYANLDYFENVDLALERCEDTIVNLERARIQLQGQKDGHTDDTLFTAVYADMMAELKMQEQFELLVHRMKAYLEEMRPAVGEYLYRQRDSCRDLFFIMRGQVTVAKKTRSGDTARVRTLGAWTMTGELGAFLDFRASCDAVVAKDARIFKLSAENRLKIEKENPKLMSDLQHLVIVMMGNQLQRDQF